jgi:tRNA nucleotidyltransferase (CCA-adding enzyme)
MKRRDFTINAMAYNDKDGLVDHFDGIGDLQRKVIRCVGNPKERFDEDALRILRAVRFAAQLDFVIDDKTKDAIQNQAIYLKDISAERIHVELTKLLVSKHPERLRTAYELGVTRVVLPEFDAMMQTEQNNKHHMYTVGEHTLAALKEVPATEGLRWAVLLHDVGKPKCKVTDATGDHFYGHHEAGVDMARDILRRLKFDNATIDLVKRLVRWHDYGMGAVPSLKSFRKSLSKMGADLFDDYTVVKYADIMAQSDYKREEKLQNLEGLKRYYQIIMEEKQCLQIKDLEINGKDLIELGMKPGKELGEILQYLLEQVLEKPEWNTREQLLKLVKSR